MFVDQNSLPALALLLVLGLLPLIAVTITAFAKISVVLMIVRNALGIQQIPPNAVLYGLAVILSMYIALPVFNTVFEDVSNLKLEYNTLSDWQRAGNVAAVPIKAFLTKHVDQAQLSFFHSATEQIWQGKGASTANEDDLLLLAPAFLLSELTRAFEIGFLLMLPFLAIDVIVTTVLIALGMMMVPPTTISIPVKLMLFVLVDGWTKITHGLILTYA